MTPDGTSGQASSTEGSADWVGEALGEGLRDSVGSALALALALGDALRELEGRGDALGDTDSVEVADGAAVTDGVGAADVASGVAAGDEDVDAEALGAADAISPVRPLSAASNALLTMALGNDDAEALSLDVALTDDVGDGEGDPESEAEADGEVLPDADGDADADADADALGEIVDDGEAGADGDALAIGSTTQGSCGALICSVAGADVSDAMAAVPEPKVAKIRLAETVMATPPERRTPRLRA